MLFGKYKKRRRGFTLTEIAVVLAIVGAITGAIWSVSINVRESQRDNAALDQLQIVSQNILNVMSGRTMPYANQTNITSEMISQQMIPNVYVDPANTALANNPWSSDNFVVYAIDVNGITPANPNTTNGFRVSFYNTSYRGCMALLLKATSCEAGQSGCPTDILVDSGANSFDYMSASTTTGWSAMTTNQARILCGYNPANGGNVEFDYAL